MLLLALTAIVGITSAMAQSYNQVITWSTPFDIPANELTGLQVGDVVHVTLKDVTEGATTDNWIAQVALDDGNYQALDVGVPLAEGQTEASFVMAGDMVRMVKENGLKITGTGYTLTNYNFESVYTGSDNSIWVGNHQGEGWVTIQPAHFVNANNGNGVKAGDVIRLTFTSTDGCWVELKYSGEDTSWSWTNFEDASLVTTATGGDIVVTESMVSHLNTDGIIINKDKIVLTQVELMVPHAVSIASGISNGHVEVDKTSALEGETVTITATPNDGYTLGSVTVKDADGNNIAVGGMKFTMPAKDVVVSATFTKESVEEPYAVLSEDYTVLTFYYDSNKEARGGMSVGPFEGSWASGWSNQRTNITTVVFDESFANYEDLTSTANWFYNCSNLTTITGISNLKTDNVTDMRNMFYNCSGLTSLDLSSFNTANVTDMYYMFYNCSGLTSLDVSKFNTANVTDMSSMFSSCSKLTSLNVSKFNTEKVTSMSGMFYGCSALTSLDVSNFNTANVTNMGWMFSSCTGLTSLDLSKFNTVNVTAMDYMFYGSSGLTELNVSNFNTANVTDMWNMFNGCSSLKSLDLSSFNTEKVTNMSSIFSDCSALTSLDLSNFNTTNLTSMGNMFDNCSSLTSLDVSNFNTTNVTSMRNMFHNCSSLTSLELSNFNTAKATNMRNMFSGCSGLTSLDVSNFNTSNVTDMRNMFYNCSSLTNLNVSNFNTTNVKNMSEMFSGCYGLTSLNVSKFNTPNVTDMSYLFNSCSGLTSLDVSNFDVAGVTNMRNMFSGCSALTTIYGDEPWNCESSTNMFYGCTSLKGAIDYDESKADGSYANPTDGYFTSTGKVHLRPYAALSEDNTTLTFYYDENKYSRNGMSVGPFVFPSLPGWYYQGENITKVVFDESFASYDELTSTEYWFSGCSNLTTITAINNLKTDNVTDMSSMFIGCSGLTNLDVSKFNTANVTSMRNMFSECSSLTSLDVSNFNTSNVTDMSSMFSYCSAMKTIYCNDAWTCETSNNMFYGCTSLVGAISYDAEKIDATYANPDTGYFTKKTFKLGDANGDGNVTITDAVAIVNYILNNGSSGFNFDAADVNGDKAITITDAVGVVNIILQGGSSAPALEVGSPVMTEEPE